MKREDCFVGQRVVYVPSHAYGDLKHIDLEFGVVKSLCDGDEAFVRFSEDMNATGQKCYIGNLMSRDCYDYWKNSDPSGLVASADGVVRPAHDPVNHPKHYTDHPSGVECITVTEHFNFNVGNAIKYLWRAGGKGDALEDLKKAGWYVAREIERREKEKK